MFRGFSRPSLPSSESTGATPRSRSGSKTAGSSSGDTTDVLHPKRSRRSTRMRLGSSGLARLAPRFLQFEERQRDESLQTVHHVAEHLGVALLKRELQDDQQPFQLLAKLLCLAQ